jgi:mannose-6-phosphate isomerase-like protein (cupin superfamily)
MTTRALVVAGTLVMPAANDVPADSPYRASVRILAPGEITPVMQNDEAEMLLLVERGSVELMVGGASFPLLKAQVARIPAGTAYAYRNNGTTDARVASAKVPPRKQPGPSTLIFAAA